MLIYIIGKTIGFSAAECGELLGNVWLDSKYTFQIHLYDVVKNSILLDNSLNETFWVIRHMFIASCLIYGSNYMCQRMRRGVDLIKIVLSVAFIMFPPTFFIGVCWAGSCVEVVLKKASGKESNCILKIIVGVSILMLCGVQNCIAEFCYFFRMNQYWEVLYSVLIIICIFSNKLVQKFLENSLLNKLGENISSFSIYMLHWHLICSVFSMIMIILITAFQSFTTAYVVCLFISIPILLFVVWVYDNTIGKLSDLLLKCLGNTIGGILCN